MLANGDTYKQGPSCVAWHVGLAFISADAQAGSGTLPHMRRTQSMSLRAVSLKAAAQCSQLGRACTSMVMAAPGVDVYCSWVCRARRERVRKQWGHQRTDEQQDGAMSRHRQEQ